MSTITITLKHDDEVYARIGHNFLIEDTQKIRDYFDDLIEPTVSALVTALKIELATDIDMPLEDAI
jgi:hypothetical protein